MNLLVFNSGSSSLKGKLLDMPSERELARGLVERIGDVHGPARLVCSGPGASSESCAVTCADHRQALALLLDALGCGGEGVAKARANIPLIGHRLVHGGNQFGGATPVDDQSLAQMEMLQELAPLHMPPALAVVRACRDRLPQARQVACFDTTFYLSMPAKSYLYAVPRDWYTEHGVRRFGFHGLSHHYVTLAAAEMLSVPLDQLKLISAHLGNGASITAFNRGRVLDTSMGFTPLEGLIMGTRAGYLDPAVLPYMQRRTGMDLEHMVTLLNTQSGLQAISGRGRDLRAIMAARGQGDSDATLAVEMYVHTLRKYIGAYCFALSGCQALVFTGGVGENSAELRALALEGLEDLGFCLEPRTNARMIDGAGGLISAPHSKVKVLVIPTDEERMIARQAYALAGKG
ncbi:MAG: acetate kinase [Desulfatitalea sp.]